VHSRDRGRKEHRVDWIVFCVVNLVQSDFCRIVMSIPLIDAEKNFDWGDNFSKVAFTLWSTLGNDLVILCGKIIH